MVSLLSYTIATYTIYVPLWTNIKSKGAWAWRKAKYVCAAG